MGRAQGPRGGDGAKEQEKGGPEELPAGWRSEGSASIRGSRDRVPWRTGADSQATPGFLGSAQVWCDACGKGGGVFRAKPGTFSYLNGSFGALKADTSFERSC